MRYIVSLLLILGCLAFERSSSVPGHLKDFDIFVKAIKNKESCLNSEIDINNNLEGLKNQLMLSDSQLDVFIAFSKSISKFNSGHTQIHPGLTVYTEWLKLRNSLPFDYFISGKKLISNKTEQADLEYAKEESNYISRLNNIIPPYSEILEINNQSLDEMMMKIQYLLPSDEGAIDFKYFQAAQMFEFYRTISFPIDLDSVPVKFIHKTDTLTNYYQLGPAPVHSINKRNKFFATMEASFKHSKGTLKQLNNETAYFRFESFSSCYGYKFESFLKKSFKSIKSWNTKNLIIDLRENTGGAMQYQLMKYFVGEKVFLGTYVVDKSQSYFWNSHIKKFTKGYIQHSLISKLQKRQIRRNIFNDGKVFTDKVDKDLIFKGRIIIITDEGTFSSASILSSNLKGLCNAEIIGRTAGGSFYRGNAGSLVLLLPNTKNEVLINPNKFTSHLKQAEDSQKIKQPDLIIESPLLPFQKTDDYYIKNALNYLQDNPRPLL